MGAHAPAAGYVALQRDGMGAGWREKIQSWFDSLRAAFSLRPETLALATNYLDRYLSVRSVAAVQFQLATAAALLVASKIEEPRPFRASDLASLSEGRFLAADVAVMELDLLVELGWRVNTPTALVCVDSLAALVRIPPQSRKRAAAVARDLADASRRDYGLVGAPPSLVATACVLEALIATGARPAVAEFLAEAAAVANVTVADLVAVHGRLTAGEGFRERPAGVLRLGSAASPPSKARADSPTDVSAFGGPGRAFRRVRAEPDLARL